MKTIIAVALGVVLLFFGFFVVVKAAPVSWDGNVGTMVLQPLQSLWASVVKGSTFQATSTTQASIFPYASTTALSSTGSAYFGTSGANVGIATTAPQNRLSIVNTGASNYTLGLESQDPGANGAGIELYHNSVSPASSDVSYIDFAANNTSGVKKYFSSVSVFPVTRTAGAEYGEYNLQVMRNGTLSTAYDFDATTNTTLIGANAVNATLNSNGSSDLILKGGSSAGATLVLQDGTSGHILASTTASGNFGVATTSPFAKLSVGGSAYIGGNLTATGTVQFTGLGVGAVQADSTGVLSSGTLPVSIGGTGSTTLTGLLKGNGTGVVQTAIAGTDYQAPLSFPLTIAQGGTATTTMRDQGVLFYNSSLGTVSQAANVNGNALNYDYTNGRLGIGTTTPGHTLAVRGDTWMGGVNSPNRSLYVNEDGQGLFRASNNTNQLAFEFRNGGITAAAQGVNLLGSFSSTTGQTAGFFRNAGRISFLTEGDFTSAAQNLGGIGFDTGSDNTLTRVLTLTSGTDAGIGSSTPYAKLTVQNATADPTAIFEDRANDSTPVVIDTSGNLLVGTTSADYLGSKFIVWGFGGRYTEQNPNGRNRMVTNDNQLAPALTLINNQDGGSVALQYQLGYGGTANIDGTSVTSGRISSIGESTFTSDTATQNAYLQFAGVVNGTLTTGAHIRGGATDGSREQLQLVSPREAITSGEYLGRFGFISNDTNLTSPGTTTAGISAVAAGTHTAANQLTDLIFSTTATGGTATNTEKMRLTGAGLLGIGTTTPPSILTLHGNTPKLTFYNTATSELRTFNGGFEKTMTYSTTTAWTGTTTIPMGAAWNAQTFMGVKCFTDTGTVNVSLYDGTNRANLVNASTTVGTNTYTTNNTFTASEKRYVDVGTPASSPTSISCTFRWYEQ